MKNILGSILALVSFSIMSCGNSPSKDPSEEVKKTGQGNSKEPVAKLTPSNLNKRANSSSSQYVFSSKTSLNLVINEMVDIEGVEQCQKAFQQMKSKNEAVANPYDQIRAEEKTWQQVILRLATSDQQIDPSFVQYKFTSVSHSKTSQAILTCTVPEVARLLDSRFQIDFPQIMQKVDNSKRYMPENGRTYGLRKIGGILWDAHPNDFYAYMDRILFNWRIQSEPTEQKSDSLKMLFQTLELVPFESVIDLQNPCSARALQVATDQSFTNASLFSAPDEKFCEPNFRFLSPAIGFAETEQGEMEYGLDIAIPVETLDTEIRDCRGPVNRQSCRKSLVPSFKKIFEETLEKSKTLYVRVLLKTKQPNKFILGNIEVDSQGLVSVTESRFISDCESEKLPKPLCFPEFRTAP